jgi:heme/copper-type cytochrome/quinol oxidase subunit 2
MKHYGFRLLSANLLAVVALLSLAVLALGHFIEELSQTAEALFPGLIIAVSVCSILFALIESVTIYRMWKASAASTTEDESKEQ